MNGADQPATIRRHGERRSWVLRVVWQHGQARWELLELSSGRLWHFERLRALWRHLLAQRPGLK